jgi:hypothetical protein
VNKQFVAGPKTAHIARCTAKQAASTAAWTENDDADHGRRRPYLSATQNAVAQTQFRQSQGNGDHGGPMLRRRRALREAKRTAEARFAAVRRRAAACRSRPCDPGAERYLKYRQGGRCFIYRPAPGPSHPSNQGCAAQIIQKLSAIFIRLIFPLPSPRLVHPSDEKPTRGTGKPGAAVRRWCPGSGDGAHASFARQRAAGRYGGLVDSG